MTSLYTTLLTYGSFIQLNNKISGPKFIDWTEDNFEYVRYNPRKPIKRYGLSITSYDGGLSGIPDLDSLMDYNKENNTRLEEQDFDVVTPVYDNSPELQKFVAPYKDDLFRTHILKLNPGGFFPRHRDYYRNGFQHVRLIAALKNPCTFLLEDKVLNWEVGRLYFLDTAKEHTLFNATGSASYWLVINYKLNEKTFNTIYDNFTYK